MTYINNKKTDRFLVTFARVHFLETSSQIVSFSLERTKDRKAIVIQIGVLGDSLRNEQSEPITSKKVSDSICY